MATAFFGTLVISCDNGRKQTDRFDSTDVTTAYVTWKSNGGNTFLKVIDNGWITDCILNITSAGDTKYFKLFIDQTDTNIAWVQNASFPNLANRMFNNNPVRVAKGQTIMIQALT